MPRISQQVPVNLSRSFTLSDGTKWDVSEDLVSYYAPDVTTTGVLFDRTGRGNDLYPKPGNLKPVLSNSNPETDEIATRVARSFTFVSNSTNDEVDYIESLAEIDDHVMGDGTSDNPFTISVWFKLDTTTSTNVILEKYAAGKRELDMFVNSANNVGFRIGSGINEGTYKGALTTGAPIVDETWHHVVVTYDGIVANSGVDSFDIYVDGVSKNLNNSSNGSYSGTRSSGGKTRLGAHLDSSGYIVASSDLHGSIYTVGIWRRKLSSSEITAIYSATKNGLLLNASSGFISRSPRLHLRELDDLPGSYPTVRRTGDSTRTGELNSNFNDQTSIVFNQLAPVVFPSMLRKGDYFSSQAVDIIGQESDIVTSIPIRSFQQPTHLHYSPTEAVGAFDENRVMPSDNFFLSGTDPDVMPGFTSPLRSKIAIEIDITPQSDVTLTRNVSARNAAEGQPVSSDNTGFYYYNFNEKKWEQIGIRDPATGAALYYDFAITTIAANTSGTFPNQFTFGNSTAKERDLNASVGDVRLELGYSKIGTPTVVMGAPSSPKYHATSSQSLKLSNFISDPFMLEAVRVDFGEIRAQRTNGDAVANSSATIFKKGSLRDIDNYVFFMYRQNRANRIVDSISDVSSSSRHLICSASMTFWNSASLSGSSWSPATLLHSPAFSYEFGLPYNDTYQVASFTGSISLNVKPAICGPQHAGISRVPEVDGTGSNFIQNSWGGGSTLQSVTIFGDSGNFVLPFDRDNGETLTDVIDRAAKIDARAFRKFGGESQDQASENLSGFGFVSIDTPQSNDSPYVLFPEDELVLGLEAGIHQLPFAELVSNITGSHLVVGTKDCKITLYGSLVKNGSEFLSNLNQNLSSNSVHEIVGAEPQLDQFQIEPISSYYGSYLDGVMSGEMAILNFDGTTFTTYDQDQSRRVVSSVVLGQAGTTASLQRFANVSDSNERTYDSCLPNSLQFLGNAVTFVNSTETVDGALFAAPYDTDSFESGSFYPNQFPFKDNPTRYVKPKDSALIANSPVELVAQSPRNGTLPLVEDIVFRTGWLVRALLSTTISGHRHSSNTSAAASQRQRSYGRAYRYGISSTTPEFSSSRWRYDRYGQLRDMLEPRLLTARFDGFNPVKIKFMSGSVVLSDATDTHSQNISTFATSSMPYFDDGTARNRNDNPDESLLIV